MSDRTCNCTPTLKRSTMLLLPFLNTGSFVSLLFFFLSCQALPSAPITRPFSLYKRDADPHSSFQPIPSSQPSHTSTLRSTALISEIYSSQAPPAEYPPPILSLQSSSAAEIAEKEALLTFKATISNDPLDILSSWSSSSSSFPCNGSWAGIGCNSEGRVESLDLKASNLTGSITPFLANLTFLSHLNLSINNFRGRVPVELGLLAALTHLDFKENSLTGPIPPELGNCTSLLWLDLSHNQLNGTLPPSLGRLKDLYMLQLHNIPHLTGPIPSQFGNLTNLTYLYLGSNNLIGRIPPQLGNLVELKELYLIINNLNGTIPPELGRLKNLEILAIFINKFEGSIPPHLGNLTSLKYMWCLMSQLEGTIPAELGNLRNLLELDLSLNSELSGGIPRELGQLKDLQVLKLFQMNLSGSIPEELGNLTNLKHLYAFGNRLSGRIPPELGQLEFLQNLQLFSNQLTGPLPIELRKLQNLQNLIIFSNSLSGNILPELGELKSLSSLYLGDNTFTGGLPSTLGNLENLQYFEVSPNLLKGPIPTSLGNLKKLVYIDLSKNKFSGTLPAELGNCTKLQWIKMANNSLSGEVPVEYTSFPELHTLALANNGFNGSLPAPFINHSSLVVLDLQRNRFKGQLPDAWARLENLRVLSVGYNLLEGSLPAWLYSLNQLQLLNLANNFFSGIISSKIGEMDGLKHNDSVVQSEERTLWKDDVTVVMKGSDAYFKYLLELVISLDMSGNALSGIIPNELSLLSGLFNLNLSHNALTGPIPGSLGGVTTLESLDLSANFLSGKIPPELTNLNALAFLNLSDNQLSGSIPKGNQFNSFTNQSYIGNADLCGYPLTALCGDANTQEATGHHIPNSKVKVIAGCVSGIVTSMLVAALVWHFLWRRKRVKSKAEEVKFQVFDKRIDISVKELLQATKNFSDDSIIGSGSSCVVYKGILSNGMVVAIKMLDRHSEAHNSFLSELTALGQIRHRNLVKILGTLITGTYKCLILEYMSNGSLDTHLHKEPCNLNWACRLDIAIGVAHGLAYLHNESGVGQILHRDLKPSNILLDEDFEPHISDFGIAKLITAKDGLASGTVFRGTFGYVAPEYANGERVTAKGDVFSYGIVLLELLTRKRPTCATLGEGTSLSLWVRSALLESWTDVIDPALLKEMGEERVKHEVHSVLVLALSCVNRASRSRPPMREVLDAMLQLKEGKLPSYKPVEQLINLATYGSFFPSDAQSTSSSNPFNTDQGSSSDAPLSL